MNKALQALIDSILLAAGTVDLSGQTYPPIAPLVRKLPRATKETAIERDSEFKTARQPERLEHKQAL